MSSLYFIVFLSQKTIDYILNVTGEIKLIISIKIFDVLIANLIYKFVIHYYAIFKDHAARDLTAKGVWRFELHTSYNKNTYNLAVTYFSIPLPA